MTGGAGAEVVYDVVGGEQFAACSRAMVRNGRLLIVDLGQAGYNDLTGIAATLRPWKLESFPGHQLQKRPTRVSRPFLF